MLWGLLGFNVIYVAYFTLMVIMESDNDNNYEKLAYLELTVWTLLLLSTLILILSICYTIKMLKRMYPGSENDLVAEEARKIKKIAIVYGVSFLTRSMFDWTMFALYASGH